MGMDFILLFPHRKRIRIFGWLLLQSRDELLLEDDSSYLLSEN